MTSELPQDDERLGRQTVDSTYRAHSSDLKNFLLGVLRNDGLAADALQATFVQLIEKGHQVHGEMRGWLFKVAFNEAMKLKRGQSSQQRLVEKVVWELNVSTPDHSADALERLLSAESIEQIQSSIKALSQDEQRVLRARIYEGLKFKEIAERDDVPLGTILARMQAALKKLRLILGQGDV